MLSRIAPLLIALSLALGAAHAQESPRRLIVSVVTRNDTGSVFCGIWRGPEGFPTQRERAVGHVRDPSIVGGRAHCVFEGLVPGEYAIAAFHDENANGEMDRGLFGIPTEGTGASNDARGVMAPPPYDGAKFQLGTAPVQRLTIHIGY